MGIISETIERVKQSRGNQADQFRSGVMQLVRLQQETQQQQKQDALTAAQHLLKQTEDPYWQRDATREEIRVAEQTLNGYYKVAGFAPTTLHIEEEKKARSFSMFRDVQVDASQLNSNDEAGILGLTNKHYQRYVDVFGERWVAENLVDLYNGIMANAPTPEIAAGPTGTPPGTISQPKELPPAQEPQLGVLSSMEQPLPDAAFAEPTTKPPVAQGGAQPATAALTAAGQPVTPRGPGGLRDVLYNTIRGYAPDKDRAQAAASVARLWTELPSMWGNPDVSDESFNASILMAQKGLKDQGLDWPTDVILAHAKGGGLSPSQQLGIENSVRAMLKAGQLLPENVAPYLMESWHYPQAKAEATARYILPPPTPWEQFAKGLPPEEQGVQNWWDLKTPESRFVGRLVAEGSTLDKARSRYQVEQKMLDQRWANQERIQQGWANVGIAEGRLQVTKDLFGLQQVKAERAEERQDHAAAAMTFVYGMDAQTADYFANTAGAEERTQFLKAKGLLSGDHAKDVSNAYTALLAKWMPSATGRGRIDVNTPEGRAKADVIMKQARQSAEETVKWLEGPEAKAPAAPGQQPAAQGGQPGPHGSWAKDFSRFPPPIQALGIKWRQELKAAGKSDAETDAEIARRFEKKGLRW